jgi:hypothetical protein
MEVRLAANTTPTAGDDAVVRILIAIELSKKSWIGCSGWNWCCR